MHALEDEAVLFALDTQDALHAKDVGPLCSQQIAEDAYQVATYRTANTAVVHLKDFFFCTNHQILVYAHLTKLVFDDRDTLAMFSREDVVEEGCFSRTEKTCQDRHWHLRPCCCCHEYISFSLSQ